MIIKFLLQDGILYISILLGTTLFYIFLRNKKYMISMIMLLFIISIGCICKCYLFQDILEEKKVVDTYAIESYSTDGEKCYYTDHNIRSNISLIPEHIKINDKIEEAYVEKVLYTEYVGYRHTGLKINIGEKVHVRIVISSEKLRKIHSKYLQ